MKFWKVGSRKIYAVVERELNRIDRGKGRKKEVITVDSDTESEEEFNSRKKFKLNQLVTDVKQVKRDVSNMLKVRKHSVNFPQGIYEQLGDTFKCSICQTTPINPPLIYTKCCGNILGCQACVNQWYGGEEGRSKNCPLCRYEQAFSQTSLIHGFDNLLASLTPFFPQSDVPQDIPTQEPLGGNTQGASSRGESTANRLYAVPNPPEYNSDSDFELPIPRLCSATQPQHAQ